MSIFEQAARRKLRFVSCVGELTAEQLWDLPLTHKSRPSLDAFAIAYAKALRDLGEFSFVEIKPNPHKDTLTLQLEVVKRVIEVKLAEAEAAKAAALKAAQKQKALEALEKLDSKDMDSKSREELLAIVNS